ncbi:MAG: zinc ribbon domain-containing protein, partial [Waterburya sp.]
IYQLKMFVAYKAAIAGVQVLSVPAAYTSQTCARCHHVHPEKGKSYRGGERFNCGNCGWKHNADINAGLIISQLGLVVTQPESSVMDCILNGQLSLFLINHHA